MKSAPRSPRQLPNTPLVPQEEAKTNIANSKQHVEEDNRKYVYNKRKKR